MNNVFIKKTKVGVIIDVNKGILRFDGKMAESLKYIPTKMAKAAQKALPGATAISGNCLFTKDEEIKINNAIISQMPQGLSDESIKRLNAAKKNEDINYITADIHDSKSFDEATEGQYNIYKD